VPGEVLNIPQAGAGVEGKGDRGVAQRVRRQRRPVLDPGGPGEAADQPPQRGLVESPSGVGGQHRPGYRRGH
jgi:hypothetical protein